MRDNRALFFIIGSQHAGKTTLIKNNELLMRSLDIDDDKPTLIGEHASALFVEVPNTLIDQRQA